MKKVRTIKERLYRDPVHGIISLNHAKPRERVLMDLLDSPEVQRLRRIRQLGLANMVYQGAEHSRFTHVIGVMHLMGVVLRQLAKGYKLEAEDIFLGQCAALLHDVGHGPFSHVFERFTEKHHEDWTREILLAPSSEVHSILSSYSVELPSRLVAILHERKHRPRVLTDLIASQLDVDRFDYLIRDSHMTGVKHGVFDLDRLISMLRIKTNTGRLVVAHKGLYPLEKYLHARFYMYRQVYQHKTVVAAEAMLTALMSRVRELLMEHKNGHREPDAAAGDLPAGLKGLVIPPTVIHLLEGGENVELDEFLRLDEPAMAYTIGELRRAPDPIASELASRLLTRRLFKAMTIEGKPPAKKKIREARDLLKKNGLDPNYHLLKIESTGVGYAPYDPKDRHAKHIDIEMPDGSYVEAAQASEIIAALTKLHYKATQLCFPDESASGRNIRRQIQEIFQ